MKKKCSICFLSVAAIILGGLCVRPASASWPILMLDIGADHDPAHCQPGFIAFTTADSGMTFKGITVTVETMEPSPPVAGRPATFNSRWRWAPTGIPYDLVYLDLIFARPGGIRITLEGLVPNAPYEITMWVFDIGSASDRIADWMANGDYCLTATTNSAYLPVDETTNRFTGTAEADGTGTIVLESYPNPNTVEQNGANNPYAIINGLMVSAVNPIKDATNPVPDDGATAASTAVQLEWTPGMLAASSNVYFGTSLAEVSNATTADPAFRGSTTDSFFLVGSAGQPYPTGLTPDKTYYWRVDEVNDLNPEKLWKGKVWSFYVPPKTAYNPSPVSGSLFADPNFPDPNVILNWYQAADATSYHVYFGDNLANVQAGTGGTDQGTVTATSYDLPNMLGFNKTYYWRVDASDGTTTYPGAVWSFTTKPQGLGTIVMDMWENITGFTLDVLESTPGYPDSPNRSLTLRRFSVGNGNGIGDNYGAQIYGWLWCPLTGYYTFWLSCADQGELWLSTDDDPVNAVQIGYEPVWGWWDAFPNKSVPIYLIGGDRYYIMARWKEDTLWDHCQVAWRGAGIRDQQIIQGSYLSPFQPVTAYGPSPAKGAEGIEVSRLLKWKSGEFASQHRVFFGTDPNAVRDATTSSPEFKGTQPKGTESFDPGTLQLEATYYWRIDEVNSTNPASPWMGEVWSFTTGSFFVVDDFERYTDDEPGRIFDTWIDGYDNPEINGAVVGYADTDNPGGHFAEVINVHSAFGSRQAMPYFYNCDGKYSEAVMTLTDRDWTQKGMDTLSLWYRGYAASVGSFVEGPTATFTMTGSGTDIAGTADEFHFAYKKLTGAGSIVAKVVSVSDTDAWAKAAVMIRESLEPGSKHAMGCVTPRSGVASEGRIDKDGANFSFAQTGIQAPHWVKVERMQNGGFVMTHSADGITWVPVENGPSQPIFMESPTVYIGLAVTSHNATATCTAVFSDVTITGDTSQQPQWENADIGITSNVAEPLYVALNGTAVVTNDNPNAVLVTDWTEWQIPLADFAAKGVNLANVDSMAIGVGTKGNTTAAGGSGTLYIDDIRLYRPAQAAGQ
jgi:hypothetical protein